MLAAEGEAAAYGTDPASGEGAVTEGGAAVGVVAECTPGVLDLHYLTQTFRKT